jgi:hypothetical protein
VALADEAFCIGPAAARESYLNVDAVLGAAAAAGADAIHPGCAARGRTGGRAAGARRRPRRPLSARARPPPPVRPDQTRSHAHKQPRRPACRPGPPPRRRRVRRRYGFLSENAPFAEACAARGVKFVGPPAAAIRAMGDKAEAKVGGAARAALAAAAPLDPSRARLCTGRPTTPLLPSLLLAQSPTPPSSSRPSPTQPHPTSPRQAIMSAAGVPVVPGYHGEDQREGALEDAAAGVGYPLLVKAVAGGGGKGMKLAQSKVRGIAGWSCKRGAGGRRERGGPATACWHRAAAAKRRHMLSLRAAPPRPQAELGAALASARREALASFGDERLLLERYIRRSRHVEVQVRRTTRAVGCCCWVGRNGAAGWKAPQTKAPPLGLLRPTPRPRAAGDVRHSRRRGVLF